LHSLATVVLVFASNVVDVLVVVDDSSKVVAVVDVVSSNEEVVNAAVLELVRSSST
jgi:hypothetical protein